MFYGRPGICHELIFVRCSDVPRTRSVKSNVSRTHRIHELSCDMDRQPSFRVGHRKRERDREREREGEKEREQIFFLIHIYIFVYIYVHAHIVYTYIHNVYIYIYVYMCK